MSHKCMMNLKRPVKNVLRGTNGFFYQDVRITSPLRWTDVSIGPDQALQVFARFCVAEFPQSLNGDRRAHRAGRAARTRRRTRSRARRPPCRIRPSLTVDTLLALFDTKTTAQQLPEQTQGDDRKQIHGQDIYVFMYTDSSFEWVEREIWSEPSMSVNECRLRVFTARPKAHSSFERVPMARCTTGRLLGHSTFRSADHA